MKREHSSKHDLLLDLMSDGEWHDSDELNKNVGHRFGSAIDKARKKGFLIDKERIKKNEFRYRLVGHNDPTVWAEFQEQKKERQSSRNSEATNAKNKGTQEESSSASSTVEVASVANNQGQNSDDRQLTDNTFQLILDGTTDITDRFDIDLGGIAEDVCQASKHAEPFLGHVRQAMEARLLPLETEPSSIKSGLIQMESWAQALLPKIRAALAEGQVAAFDATPVIPHRRYLTSQVFACAVGFLTSQNPVDIQTTLAKTMASVDYTGSLKNIRELIQKADILTGSQSWPSAYMEYQTFKVAMNTGFKHIVIDGNLITQNLLTRKQGRELFSRMLESTRKSSYVGVIKDITRSHTELRLYGRALKSGEMFIQGPLSACMSSDRLSSYRGATADFIQTVGADILRGVYKPGVKAFGFECHRDDLVNVIALLWADRDQQPGHEIPFLMNQVDAQLRSRFRPQETLDLVESYLAQNFDSDLFFDEINERMFR